MNKIFSIDSNPRIKTDFVNSKGVNVSRLYRDVNMSVPSDLSKLDKAYEFRFDSDNENYGRFGHFYELGSKLGVKVLFDWDRDELRHSKKYQDAIRSEYVNHLTGVELGHNLPDLKGLYLVHDLSSGLYVPGIVMENLGKDEVGDFILNQRIRNVSLNEFKKNIEKLIPDLENGDKVDVENFPHIVNNDFLGPDIRTGNSRWFNNKAYFLDPAKWRFKGTNQRIY